MKTMLYDKHVALGAKMVNFAGWEMPLYYKGVVAEHLTVRESVGIFDVSHMGRVIVEGKDAQAFLEYLSTNHIAKKKGGTATYTVWCDEKGFAVDDVLVFKETPEAFFVVLNAGCRDKDLSHMKKHAKNFDVEILELFSQEGILAIQGPGALLPETEDLEPMHFMETEGVIVSATGYTGEKGFELFGEKEILSHLWEEFLAQGITPVGLGARDTLRLEMGYALYGHELSETISPLESVAAWTVKMDKGDFLGKEALLKQTPRHHYGIILEDKGVPREGCSLFHKDEKIGTVTSGTFSPILQKGIALVLSDKELSLGDEVEIEVRKKRLKSRVTKVPFISSL